MKRHPLPSGFWQWWEKATPVREHLPLSLLNGSVVDTMTFCCKECGTDAAPDEYRADLHRLESGAVVLAGHALCRPCRVMHPMVVHVQPDGRGFSFKDITTEWPRMFTRDDRRLGGRRALDL